MRRELSALAFGALLALGCSGNAEEPLGTSADVISGGALDRTHRAVYQEFTRWPGEDRVSACTASLIAPNLLLTARHCVSGGEHDNIMCGRAALGNVVPGNSVAVTNAAILDSSSVFHRGADVRVPAEGNDTCGFDVALIILEDLVPGSEAMPAVPRIDRNATAGEPYVAIGYGQDETGAQTPGRMLRDGLTVACDVGSCPNFGVASTEFVGESGVCQGDSGGPALDADGKIVGVVSRGADPCEQPVYSSVASWSEWITATALDAAAAGGYDPPFWALSGTSDPPIGVLGEGDACTAGDACAAGLVCFYAKDPNAARCTATCGESTECSSGKSCQKGYAVEGGGLCLDRAPSTGAGGGGGGADEGCAVAPSPGRSSESALGWLALGLVMLLSRGGSSARRRGLGRVGDGGRSGGVRTDHAAE
jgi:V8-like Glu-specific endopeptidase